MGAVAAYRLLGPLLKTRSEPRRVRLEHCGETAGLCGHVVIVIVLRQPLLAERCDREASAGTALVRRLSA